MQIKADLLYTSSPNSELAHFIITMRLPHEDNNITNAKW